MAPAAPPAPSVTVAPKEAAGSEQSLRGGLHHQGDQEVTNTSQEEMRGQRRPIRFRRL